MILSNYYNYISKVWANFSGGDSTSKYTNIGCFDYDGLSINVLSTYNGTYPQMFTAYNCMLFWGLEIDLGSGTTAPNVTDYKLSNIFETGIKYTTTKVITSDGKKTTCRFTIEGSNNGTSEITISEIGIYKKIYFNTDSASGYRKMLITKSLLGEKSITVQPNLKFTIDYEMCF